ncbi:competence protein ComEC [Rhizobiales bacterium GAS113]|nr:competence protein ComEC [Rhizobiales bacterium GAS113]
MFGRHIGHPGGLVTGVRRGGVGEAIGAKAVAGGIPVGIALREAWLRLRGACGAAIELEIEQRRLFLWLPVAAGAGVVLYFAADREPSLGYAALVAAASVGLCVALRHWRAHFAAALLVTAIACGFLSATLRSYLLAAPVLDRPRVLKLTGTIEEMNLRRQGARFILRVAEAQDLRPDETPYRVRLTTKETPRVEAGDFVAVTARLLPPARAALPGGYDFARDAYFARLGAVGSVLGHITAQAAPAPPDLRLRLMAAVDRARNALAQRVFAILGGDEGAVAAAMVTGKRELLSDKARELIREAGIFHIITISGVQMTLVAGMIFWVVRRLLAFSSVLALRYPIKKWAAAVAMLGAIAYDICTGSRVGTERALFMTLIVLAAVLADRRAFTMRNLAYAAFAVIAFEPEAILGASFQLSFAAVSALVAVSETRMAMLAKQRTRLQDLGKAREPPPQGFLARIIGKAVETLAWLLFATLCATSATASYMAYDFHELSPYVLIGNPLTLTIIEFFAVPGALIGALLYPLGLDGFVWHYLGAGIQLIFWAARQIAAAPGATLYLHTFAPWAILFLTLAVLSAVIWKSWLLRSTALIFLALGLLGAVSGEGFDMVVAPGGDAATLRLSDGKLAVVGARPNLFAAEQWLRADGDSREAHQLLGLGSVCDRLGCVGKLRDGSMLAVVMVAAAFEDDCLRADIVVTPLRAPANCVAPLILDRPRLEATGAVSLRIDGDHLAMTTARSVDENRPWSRPPRHARPAVTAGKSGTTEEEPEAPSEERAEPDTE